MKQFFSVPFQALAIVTFALAAGCSSKSFSTSPNDLADSGKDSGPYSLPSCDPNDGDCQVDSDHGVFVSPLGSFDEACGSLGHPCKSIQAGLRKGKLFQKRVFVCTNGTDYNESVVIDRSLDGVQVYGGFGCDSWTYLCGAKSVINPNTDGGIALQIQHLAQGAELYDLEILAPSAVSPGKSSQALWVYESQNVKLTRLWLQAGDGQNGENAPPFAANGANNGHTGHLGLTACSGNYPAGGEMTLNICGVSTPGSIGGKGGDGAFGGGPASDGNPGMPASNSSGLGGHGEDSAHCTPGGNGRAGNQGHSGVPASGLGQVTIDGWIAPQATSGGNGTVGQGGGGGGGAKAPDVCSLPIIPGGASGGSGGAGGCGGKGGGAGQSGGASIALGSVRSGVFLLQCRLIAASGGNGGFGIKGQSGGAGGLGEEGGIGGLSSHNACSGGDGGDGGGGGPGGGGAGGPSIGILFQGAMPHQQDTIIEVGQAGLAGQGGCSYVGASIDPAHCQPFLAGEAGVARSVLEIP